MITFTSKRGNFQLNNTRDFWDREARAVCQQNFGYTTATVGGVGVCTTAMSIRPVKDGPLRYGSHLKYIARHGEGNVKAIVDSIVHFAKTYEYPHRIKYGNGIKSYNDIPTCEPLMFEFTLLASDMGGMELHGDLNFIHGTYADFPLDGLGLPDLGFEHKIRNKDSETTHIWTLSKETAVERYGSVVFVAMDIIEQHVLNAMAGYCVAFRYWLQNGKLILKAEMDPPTLGQPREIASASEGEE